MMFLNCNPTALKDFGMIKKIVSDALLSVFMDKKAREKLKASREAKSNKKSTRAGATPVAKQDTTDDLPTPVAPDPMGNMGQDEITSLIRDSLEAAEQEITDKKQKHAANPGRQALIEQAMAIHQSKKHIVDELPEEQREKLVFMAQQALGARLNNDK